MFEILEQYSSLVKQTALLKSNYDELKSAEIQSISCPMESDICSISNLECTEDALNAYYFTLHSQSLNNADMIDPVMNVGAALPNETTNMCQDNHTRLDYDEETDFEELLTSLREKTIQNYTDNSHVTQSSYEYEQNFHAQTQSIQVPNSSYTNDSNFDVLQLKNVHHSATQTMELRDISMNTQFNQPPAQISNELIAVVDAAGFFDQPRKIMCDKDTITEQKVYECHKCKYDMKRSDVLNRHVKQCKGNSRPFICKYCELAFSKREYLQRHKNVHTKQLTYVCEKCLKKFYRKDYLNKHLKSHKKKNYKVHFKERSQETTAPKTIIRYVQYSPYSRTPEVTELQILPGSSRSRSQQHNIVTSISAKRHIIVSDE